MIPKCVLGFQHSLRSALQEMSRPEISYLNKKVKG